MAKRKDEDSTGTTTKALEKPKPAKVAAMPEAAAPLDKAGLTEAQADLLQDVCDEGQSTIAEMGASLLSFGRYAFRKVFDNDSTLALGEDAAKNPVWKALCKAAGGPRLRLTVDLLRAAVRMAALDQRLNDDAFRGLDWSRKLLLLPLGDDQVLRDAAQHVVDHKLNHERTTRYVAQLRAGTRKEVKSRLTPERAASHLTKLVERFTQNRALPKLRADAAKMTEEDRAELRAKVRAAKMVLEQLDDALDD